MIAVNSQISLKFRPNNQITVTRGNWRKKSEPVTQRLQNDLDKVSRYDIQGAAIASQVSREMYQKRRKSFQKPSAAQLDIIKKSQEIKTYPCSKLNRPKSFTKNSGQKIRECGGAMDLASGGDTRFCHEVTLTLAGDSPEIFASLAANTGFIINRLFQPIRDKYGDMCLWFYVWEYQKRGALHIHIALYHPDECEGLYISALLIKNWEKILLNVGERADICMFTSKKKDRCTIKQNHQNHCQPITKNVGAYFSKYAGKEESKNNWYCQKYPVSRFWGSSKQIKEIIKANSKNVNFDYQGNEKEADKKYQEIIESIINELEIVDAKSYDFCIQLSGKSRLNRCKDGKKYLSVDDGKFIASGHRETFYIPQNYLKKCLEIIERISGF